MNSYPDTGPEKRIEDSQNSGFQLYRFLPASMTTYEVPSPSLDDSTPSSADEQATISLSYGFEEDVNEGVFAYGLTKSKSHQGADDVNDKSQTDFTHNARGFITSHTEFTFSGDANVTTTYRYNTRGELEQTVDSAGRVTRYDYDMLGRLTQTEEYGNVSESLPVRSSYNYYNLNGDLTWVDGPRRVVEDYVFHDYDGAGRIIAKVVWRSEAFPLAFPLSQSVSGQNDFLGQSITYYDYDAFGNLTSMIDPRGNETIYDYDALVDC